MMHLDRSNFSSGVFKGTGDKTGELIPFYSIFCLLLIVLIILLMILVLIPQKKVVPKKGGIRNYETVHF